MDSPLIKHQFHFFGTEIHSHFRPHNSQNYFHVFLNKEYPSRRRPLPLGVCRNSTIPVPTRSSCSGDQLCLVSPGFDGSIVGKFREKVDPSLSKTLSFFPSIFSSFFSLIQSVGSRELVPSLATCHISIGSLDFTLSTYPSTMDFHHLTRCHTCELIV